MRIPRGTSERRKYFQEKYETLWANFQDILTETEKAAIDLRFGISGPALTNPEIAKCLNFTSPRNSQRIVSHALNQLRKASVKAAKAHA